jgi:pimeloyl-ACP methyl ester carboxylesterase
MKNTETKTVVLIHGLWLTPHSWEPFRKFFTGLGYDVHAPAWPRMGDSIEAIHRNPSALAGLGLREITEHYGQFIEELGEPPILIGHSIGGLVVQVLLGCGLGAAGVSIDGTAPKGVYRLPLSVMKAASPVLSNPVNINRTVTLTFEQFRYVFANTMTRPVALRKRSNSRPGPSDL